MAPGIWEREVALFSSLLMGPPARHTVPVPSTQRLTLWGTRGGMHAEQVPASLSLHQHQQAFPYSPDLIKPSMVCISYQALHIDYPRTHWLRTQCLLPYSICRSEIWVQLSRVLYSGSCTDILRLR